MRITVGDGHDIEVAPGVTAGEIAQAARSLGVDMATVWCGDAALDLRHPAGAWPLLEGAHLTPERGLPCAPTRGLELVALAGPSTGARAAIGPDGIVVGRGHRAGLRLSDPTVSRAHLNLEARETLAIGDLGSANGTIRLGDSRSRRIGRRGTARPGDVLALGSSLVAVVDGHLPAETSRIPPEPVDRTPTADRGRRLTPLAGSAAGGVMIAAMTGRWYLAILGLLYPAIALLSQGDLQFRRPRATWDLSVLPSLLPSSRRTWSESPPRCLALIGDPDRTRGFARAVVLAVGRRPRLTDWREDWMQWLPEASARDPEYSFLSEGEAPSWSDARVSFDSAGATLTWRGRTTPLPEVRMGALEAEALARSLRGGAEHSPLPRQVRWADLATDSTDSGIGLSTPLGLAESGVFTLDLDRDGPHFLVAGTTGSGKSALLETLLLGLASRYGPDRLGLGLIDFKGGAGTRALRTLPHVRGLLTDLDPHLARRALLSLSRELEDRKAMLLDAGLSSFGEWEAKGGAPPRLLVVADEYQELAAQYQEFLPDLARLAAQGRSLGLHLVLATQRPAGAVTPAIRANVGTTLALRVVTDAESRDLIGTPDAAALPIDAPGRAIALTGTLRTVLQVAIPCPTPTPRIRLSEETDVLEAAAETMAESACDRWSSLARPDPLWLPPLPVTLEGDPRSDRRPSDDVEDMGLLLGIGDLPAERRQSPVFWDPRTGPLLVSGPPRSGRTNTLRLLSVEARAAGLRPVWLPEDPREAARTIALLPENPDALLLIDDAHRAFAILADVDRGTPLEALTSLACSGAPLALAFSKGAAHRLASQAASQLVLSSGDPVDDASWSMPRDLQGITGPPGRARYFSDGRWCECQIGCTSERADEPIVRGLPKRIPFEDLNPDDDLVVGVGGDDAAPFRLPADRPLLLLGPSGRSRSAVEASLTEIASHRGVPLSLSTAENPYPRPHEILETGTVLVVEPNDRVARELFRGPLDGLVDPHPPLRRVLALQDDRALAVHIADPPTVEPR